MESPAAGTDLQVRITRYWITGKHLFLREYIYRWTALLALTLGFESLYRCQIECKLMGRRMFRLYRPQPVHWQVLKSVVISVGMALAPINFYRHSPRLQK